MSMIASSLLSALKGTWVLKKMVLFLFIANVLFALVVALPINFLLKNRISHSYLFRDSIGEFNFSFIGDMINNKGAELMMLLNQSYWIIVMYLLLTILFIGGIIHHIVNKNQRFNIYEFLQKGMRFFWKYFRLSIFFIILQAALLFFMWTIFQSALNGLSPFELETDTQIVNTFYLVTPIYVFLASILLMIQDYSKIFIYQSTSKFIFPSICKSVLYCARNFFKTYLLYFLFLLILALGYIIFKNMESIMATNTFLLIMVSFILSQLFIFFRLFIRVANLFGVYHLSNQID